MDVELKIGDIVLDITNNDIGVLLKRYTLLDDTESNKGLNVWAWDLYWVGPESESSYVRTQAYTESGLINLIKTSTFLLNPSLKNYGNIKRTD